MVKPTSALWKLFIMAGVLEKRERRTYLDDTTPLTVTIVTNRMRDTHVVSSTEQNTVHSTSWQLCRYSSCTAFVILSVFFQEYVIKVYRGPNPEEGWEVSCLQFIGMAGTLCFGCCILDAKSSSPQLEVCIRLQKLCPGESAQCNHGS